MILKKKTYDKAFPKIEIIIQIDDWKCVTVILTMC